MPYDRDVYKANSFYGVTNLKPEDIFRMFGEYFEKNDVEVREELYKWVSEGNEEIEGNIRIA